MAHEKPHNDDGWFDPHPGKDFDQDNKQPGDQNQPDTNTDQPCALALEKNAPKEKDRHHDKQEKNHPE